VIPAVYSAVHQGHAPTTEIELGQTLGQYELPVRAEEIRRALEGEPERFSFVQPVEHGVAPIEGVHDPGLVAFLATAWEQVRAEQALATQAQAQVAQELAEVFPDTFVHPALREGMGAAPAPDGAAARLGYWCFETMTPLVAGTYPAARAAVDVALTAADLVLDGARVAYGLCRPPGHHAPRAAYGGYCYFNNAAVVADHAARATGTRVTVLDVDYHHGNGSQQIFYERGDVQYVSLHGDPNRAYPYFAGYADERGAGRGAGSTLNLPFPPGTDDAAYETGLARALEAIDAFGPTTLVVSLGVDTFELDPIADFALTTGGFARAGGMVAELGRPTIVLQEGGYHVPTIGENVRTWLAAFDAAASA
jgi:acetoin utilization deacetylase AcuC-like enzyme